MSEAHARGSLQVAWQNHRSLRRESDFLPEAPGMFIDDPDFHSGEINAKR